MSKKYIFYCERKNYKFFEDYIKSIFTKLKSPELVLYSDKFDVELSFTTRYNKKNKTKHIFMFMIPENLELKQNMYLCNTEQLTRHKWKKYVCELLNKGIKILDYSEENIHMMSECSNDISRFNIFHMPYQVNESEILNLNKISDVCIVGSKNDRRVKIYKELKKRGVKVNYVFGWNDERDKKMFKHKILLNIHYDDNYNITEQMRINRCIFNKMLVISVPSDHKEYLSLKKYIIFSNYDTIVEKTIHILKNYEKYYEMFYNNFDNELKNIDKKLSEKLEIIN